MLMSLSSSLGALVALIPTALPSARPRGIAGSAEERGGGLGAGGGAVMSGWSGCRRRRRRSCTRTACRASWPGYATSGSRSPAMTPPSRSSRSRSGTRVSVSTSPTSTFRYCMLVRASLLGDSVHPRSWTKCSCVLAIPIGLCECVEWTCTLCVSLFYTSTLCSARISAYFVQEE